MISVGYLCDECSHKREKIDGWRCACDAFPKGILEYHYFHADETSAKDCSNGIGYQVNLKERFLSIDSYEKYEKNKNMFETLDFSEPIIFEHHIKLLRSSGVPEKNVFVKNGIHIDNLIKKEW